MRSATLALPAMLLLLSAACGGRQPEPATPAPAPAPADGVRAYAALPDTLVCVVDRTTDRGLRELTAKKQPGGGVALLVDDRVRPLDELHPVNLIAGYAGQEPWFTRSQPVSLQRRQYMRYGGERRVPIDKLKRVGEFQGIPLFAAPEDTIPPPAVYAPVRSGCIFQAYVRDDLYRGR